MRTRNRLSHTEGRNVETPADIRLGCMHGRSGRKVAVERGAVLRRTTHLRQFHGSVC